MPIASEAPVNSFTNIAQLISGSLSTTDGRLPEMRQRATPTKLERHRLKFVKNGRRGPLLRLSGLAPVEKQMIQSELVQDVRVQGIDFSEDGDELRFDQVYSEVLSRWGVICPHPISSLGPSTHPKALSCNVCGCLVAQWGWREELRLNLEKENK